MIHALIRINLLFSSDQEHINFVKILIRYAKLTITWQTKYKNRTPYRTCAQENITKVLSKSVRINTHTYWMKTKETRKYVNVVYGEKHNIYSYIRAASKGATPKSSLTMEGSF